MLTDTPTNKLKPESHLMSLFQKKKIALKKNGAKYKFLEYFTYFRSMFATDGLIRVRSAALPWRHVALPFR